MHGNSPTSRTENTAESHVAKPSKHRPSKEKDAKKKYEDRKELKDAADTGKLEKGHHRKRRRR